MILYVIHNHINKKYRVAPHVGAWIETFGGRKAGAAAARSLPTWERGLKQEIRLMHATIRMSLPTWERGLKHKIDLTVMSRAESLPTWERGLKR